MRRKRVAAASAARASAIIIQRDGEEGVRGREEEAEAASRQ